MLLLVGLGNPNLNNSNNRHNVGFSVIDAINEKFKLSKQKPKFKGLLTTGKIDEQKVFAIKPLTFMNSSGICIKELIEYFKINVKDVFVFHDDMDIDIGKVKVKFGGRNAGHNGIDSIPLWPALLPPNLALILPKSISISSWNTKIFFTSILK